MIKEKNQVFKCRICGNIVEALHTGQGDLICCGEVMEEIKENTQEGVAQEKHIPVVKTDGDVAIIKIGAEPHPMTEEHYIEWVEIIAEEKVHRHWLKPGMEPKVALVCKVDKFVVRAYCNLHGLWSTTVEK